MSIRRLGQVSLAIAGIMLPHAVAAQADGLVTVGPLIAGAPVLSMVGLGMLVLALVIGALAMLRRAHPLTMVVLAPIVVAGVSAVGYAAAVNLIVSGDECGQITQKSFSPLDIVLLESQCPNSIRIVDLEINCGDVAHGEPAQPPAVPLCEVGLVVGPGEMCQLPSCPC
ncbi:MAG: hypothetical protein SF182_10245 [Deltaproteobacteria bacterium]|nr:hypothetical protein [Deltaproteobacteria bacterium]